MLCLATAANAIGAIGGIIVEDDCEAAVDDIADAFSGGAGASECGCNGFLLGVEHTIDLFNDVELIVDVEEFRSDLLARTAVGLTGYKKTQKELISEEEL